MFYVKRPGEFTNNILSNQTVFFYSPNSTGKTEFIKNELLLNSNIIYIDLSSTFTLKDLGYLLIQETSNFFNREIKNFELKTNDINIFKSALLYAVYESEDKRLEDLIICFDNFNYILDFHLKNESEVFKIIADVLQKSDIKMIFSLNTIDGVDIFLNPNSYLFDFAKNIPFQHLEKEEILNTVNTYLKNFNISINMKNLDLVLADFGMNLRYLQQFVKELLAYKKIDDIVIKECLEKVYLFAEYDLSIELVSLIGKKTLSDILYYVAIGCNVYAAALENHSMSKHNTKHSLNTLAKLGLVVQEQNYKKYICRNSFLKRYILEKFNKRVKNGTN